MQTQVVAGNTKDLRNQKEKQFTDNTLATCYPVGTMGDVTQFRELQTSFGFERYVFESRLGPIPCKSYFCYDCLYTQHPLVSGGRKGQQDQKNYFLFVFFFCWIVFCFFTQVKGGQIVRYLTCHHMSSHVSPSLCSTSGSV